VLILIQSEFCPVFISTSNYDGIDRVLVSFEIDKFLSHAKNSTESNRISSLLVIESFHDSHLIVNYCVFVYMCVCVCVCLCVCVCVCVCECVHM